MRFPYKSIRKAIRDVSAFDEQTIQVVMLSKQPCPDCVFDPVTGASSDTFCDNCDGVGFVEVEAKQDLEAQVEYVTGLETEYERGGKLQKGQVILTVHIDEIERLGISPSSLLSLSPPINHFVISDKQYEIQGSFPGELEGQIYEIIFTLSLPKAI